MCHPLALSFKHVFSLTFSYAPFYFPSFILLFLFCLLQAQSSQRNHWNNHCNDMKPKTITYFGGWDVTFIIVCNLMCENEFVRGHFHYCVQSHVWRWVINLQTIKNMVVGENNNVTERVCLWMRTQKLRNLWIKIPSFYLRCVLFFFLLDLGFSLFRWIL